MAFERLLVPFVEQRVLADDEDLIVVDKPNGLVVHGGDERLHADLVSRLAARFEAAGKDTYLGVHQRLDQDASGVIAFTRRRAINARVAADFETHAARRRYVCAVELPLRTSVEPEGVLEHRLASDAGRARIVERGGKLARSSYRILEQNERRALLELRLETGRTHQLRVQLKAANMPIAGDVLYGGSKAPRLMLHAIELELPSLGRRFFADAPGELADWLMGSARLPPAPRIQRALADAGSRRWPLLGRTTAFRLVNDLGDGLAGVTIDCYGGFCVLEAATTDGEARRTELADDLMRFGADGVYYKSRVRGAPAETAVSSEPLLGAAAPEPFEVHEGELRFEVSLGTGRSTGLFVDQRTGRELVSELARGKRVLNLFAYTGSFTVAAAAGGASHTVSVDLSARALERARRNLSINDLSSGAHRLLRADAIDWLARARRRRDRFDLAILDPPTFATIGKGRTFSVERDYVRVASAALCVLVPGGVLYAVTNHRGTSQAALRRLVHDAAREARRRILHMKDAASPLDCPKIHGEPHPSRSVLVTVE